MKFLDEYNQKGSLKSPFPDDWIVTKPNSHIADYIISHEESPSYISVRAGGYGGKPGTERILITLWFDNRDAGVVTNAIGDKMEVEEPHINTLEKSEDRVMKAIKKDKEIKDNGP